MSPEILDVYLKNGKFDTIRNLFNKENGLKRSQFKCSDADFENYIKEHGDEDYVERYIKYCE